MVKKIKDLELNDISILLQCKNSCRVNNLLTTITNLNRNVNVIIDEAHQAIDSKDKKCMVCKDKNSIATWGYGKNAPIVVLVGIMI